MVSGSGCVGHPEDVLSENAAVFPGWFLFGCVMSGSC